MQQTNIFTPNAAMFSELCKILPELVYGGNNYVRRNVQIQITTISEFVVVFLHSIREFDSLYTERIALRWNTELGTYAIFTPSDYTNLELAELAYCLHRQLVSVNDISNIVNANPYVVGTWISSLSVNDTN